MKLNSPLGESAGTEKRLEGFLEAQHASSQLTSLEEP